jgi:hypothetical protein
MIIHNAAQEDIAVRPFAQGCLVDFSQVVKIAPGCVHSVCVNGLSSESSLFEHVVVRDWGRPSMEFDESMLMLRLWPDSVLIHKVTHVIQNKYEGFLLTFWRLRGRIRYWPAADAKI